MGKYVYLFELDSVRKTDEEIVKAQQTLYDEIVGNGNTVVMTYNQIVDSRGFFCLLDNEDYYSTIINLFKKGRIKVSQYGEFRTISQYLLNSIERESEFIYSALPVKSNQKRLLALMRRSLIYSDLSEIYGYLIDGNHNEDELCDLFVELCEYKDANGNIKEKEEKSKIQPKKMRMILNNLYWMLSYILELSPMHEIYLPPRNKKEYDDYTMYNFIKIVLDLPISSSHWDNDLWNRAKSVILRLENYDKDNDDCNDRTTYLINLRKQWEKETINQYSLESYQLAESIINQCYNYACEMSICNISKHYDVDELMKKNSSKYSFQSDFFLRLSEDWNQECPRNKRYLTNETNEFEAFDDWRAMRFFIKVATLTEYTKDSTESHSKDEIYRYEYNLKNQQKENKQKIKAGILKRILFLCGYFIFIALFNTLIDVVLGQLLDSFVTNPFFSSFLTLFLMLPIEFLSLRIQKRYPKFISFSETIVSISHVIKDFLAVIRIVVIQHTNSSDIGLEKHEIVSIPVPIKYIKSKELKHYIDFRKKSFKTNGSLFRDSNIYSLYDVNDDSVVEMILRNEEIYNRKYGIIYQSRFNILLVDPVKYDGECIPYERMTPASGHDGVVMVAKHNNKYILLNQFRHALREKQYSFPRGFAESANPVDDAVRELKEELHAQAKGNPYYLGRIAPDSGLTATQAYVYCVDIESYSTSEGHEGIVNAVEVPCGEFEQWIEDNKIDDGYTLGAYMLLKTKMSAAVS